MARRAATVLAVMLMLTVLLGGAAIAQDSGYPTPLPSFSESEPPDDPSDPPTVPPGPPPETPPGPPPEPPPDPPSLAATGFAVTTGMAAAAGLVAGGAALVRVARRRRSG